jgi:Helix-turn-helix domain
VELALEVREVAAVDLVARGQLDPRDALALVAWPSVAVAAASVAAVDAGKTRKRRPKKEELRALELVDRGWSWAAAGREVGAPKQTVGTWVRKRRAVGAVDLLDRLEADAARPARL